MCAAAGDKEMALKGITIHPLYFSEEFNRTYTVVLIIEAKLLKCWSKFFVKNNNSNMNVLGKFLISFLEIKIEVEMDKN